MRLEWKRTAHGPKTRESQVNAAGRGSVPGGLPVGRPRHPAGDYGVAAVEQAFQQGRGVTDQRQHSARIRCMAREKSGRAFDQGRFRREKTQAVFFGTVAGGRERGAQVE